MADISIEIMLSAPTPPAGREALAWRPGHGVAIYPAARIADRVGQNYRARGGVTMPRTGYIHVLNVPGNIGWRKFRRALTNSYRVDDPIVQIDGKKQVKKRLRLFRLRPSLVPAAARSQLLADREITVTFTQLKNYVRKLTVPNVSDPSLDTETIALIDADFD